MRLIKPYTEILHLEDGPTILRRIELAGRTCYKSEDKITPDSSERFVKMLLKRHHDSVIEHGFATVKFVIDRGVSHELVRHRLASFSQESTRYCDYSGGHVTFVIPPWDNTSPGVFGSARYRDPYISFWLRAMIDVEAWYDALRKSGQSSQQARSVLPNSLKTEVVVTANYREWRHIFKLRCGDAAHPQMREVMIPLRDEFCKRVPALFSDVVWT